MMTTIIVMALNLGELTRIYRSFEMVVADFSEVMIFNPSFIVIGCAGRGGYKPCGYSAVIFTKFEPLKDLQLIRFSAIIIFQAPANMCHDGRMFRPWDIPARPFFQGWTFQNSHYFYRFFIISLLKFVFWVDIPL